MVLTVPHIIMPASLHFLMQRSALGPVIRQGGARVGEVVLLLGGDHHQQAVRPDALFAQGDGTVHGAFADGDGREHQLVVVDHPFVRSAF
jgi:hypothetical protein